MIKITLIYFMLPLRGLDGLIFVLYAGGLCNTSLSLHRLLKVTGLRLRLGDWILKPILSAAASVSIVTVTLNIAAGYLLSNVLYISAGVVSSAVLYFIFLIKLGGLTKDDFKWYKIIFKYSFSRGGVS